MRAHASSGPAHSEPDALHGAARSFVARGAADDRGHARAVIESPVGVLLTEASDAGVVRLDFPGREPAGVGGAREGSRVAAAHLKELRRQLAAYFAGESLRFSVPLALEGSEFDRAVWELLLKIPAGTTRSYLELATALGRPGGSRAVGGANGRNPVAIVVPCHRVINSDGGLGGYGGGLDRKRWLLEHERRWTGASVFRGAAMPPLGAASV